MLLKGSGFQTTKQGKKPGGYGKGGGALPRLQPESAVFSVLQVGGPLKMPFGKEGPLLREKKERGRRLFKLLDYCLLVYKVFHDLI